MDNRPISELDRAISVNDEDILLISQKENNEYVSRKIGAGVFRGDSAYELAVKEGFKGDLNSWLASIKGWQPITSGEFVSLLDSELDKSKLYKDLNNRLNASTTSLKEDINKQLNDVNNLRQQVVAEADKRIQEIHDLNSGLIEEANKRIQDIKLVQDSITLETSERLEQAVELANQILLEKDSRTDDIKNLIEKLNSEQSDRVAAVQQVTDLLSSEIETRRSLLSETVQKINKETSDRVKEIEAVRNSITQEQLARVSELEDIMENIDAVDAKVGTNHSFLLNNYSTTKTASEETAKQIEALRTTYIDPILEEKASTTALEQVVTELGRVDDSLKANIEKVDGVFAQINPSMAGTESGFIGDESKYVGVWTEQSARIEEDFALGKRVDNVVATYTSNKETTDARIAREEKARADGDSALASVVTSLTTRVGNSEGKLITLEQVNTGLDSSLSQISSKLDNTIQEVSTKASSSALEDLASNVEVLEGSVSSTTNSITALENSLETTNTNLNKKADSAAVNELSSKVTAIDETVNSNSSNIITLTNSLGSKNKTYYQPSVPTENVSVGDIWINSTPSKNNELKRYNGLYWDVISDPRVSSNSSAISALESKTTQHDEELTSQSSLITDLKADLDVSKQDLLLKADSSALNDLSNIVSNIGGNISSVSGDVTELKNNLETLEADVQTKASAIALEDLSTKVERTNNSVVSQGQDITNLNNSLVTVNTNINSKGRVIYSENEPSEVERLAQNLWIDTKDGNNTPKRWDGVEWLTVTDKVAAEALAKAQANSEVLTTKADASAVSSLTNKVENVEKTVTSQSNDLVVLTNSLEQTSQLAADKGKVIFSNVEPEESEKILQNLWIDTSNNNNTPKRWTGTKWSTVTDKVALDALTASQAVSDALTTKADSSAVSSLESKVTDLGQSISSQSQDITTLNNSLVLANNTISGKGKIIYSDSAPAEGDRLPQNLWIDTTSGGNIPKRWNGEFWLVITDKTALDALAAANQVKEDLADKVDSSAFNSLTSRVNSSEKEITSQSNSITKLNNDLTVTDQIAREALSDSKDLKEQITTKASTEALENLTSSVISIDGKVTTNTQKVLELTGTVEAIGENLSTKADASVLTDYSTKIDTNEAISKANTTLTSSYTKAVEDVRTEANTKLDDQLLITKASTSGKLLYADATFLKGFNSVSAYDNNSTNKVVVDRITREIDNPTKSSHQLKITIANGATPGYGGFYQLVPSRANAIFVIKYLMKVPNTYTVIPTSNALGSGSSDKIIGSAAGTGKYETYVRVIRCGDSGSFSTGGHLYFYGTSLPKDSTDTVMLASIECLDATDFVKSATSDEVATISASLVNDYYTKTDADKAVSNSLTAFQTNYVDKELNKKASANTVDQISNEIHNTETGLDATAKKLSGVYAQVNPELIGSTKGFIGKDSGSVSVWSEYSARIEGDTALSSRIDSVKSEWENSLAVVQTQTKTATDKLSSLASQVTVLSSAVEGNISLVMDQYYTKVQTDEVVSQNIVDLKANYINPELGLKASAQALQETQSQVTEIDGKLKTTSQKTDGVYAQVNPDLVGSDSGSIGTENQNVGSWSQYSALIEGDFATSQKIDVVSAAVANNTASIKQTNTVVIDKFKSVAESLNRVETKFNDNLSSVNSVIGVWSDKDKSISKYIIDLNSLVGSNQAEITRNYLTSADTTKAITEGIDKFKTEYLSDELKKKASAEVLDQVKSAIENTETGLVATADKLDGVFVKVNPKLIGSDRDFIGSTSSSVGVWTEQSARIEEDFALGQRIDNLYVNLGKNAAAIQTVNNILVDKTQALAKSITQIDSKFESSVGSINTTLGTWTTSESSISDYITTVNSAVGKNSSSIQVQGRSIDGLSSQYTVKIDTNGRVSGFGLASNPTNQATSEFAVLADKFYIASPDTNGKGKNPFYVLTKTQVVDGETIPAGVYIDQTFIRKASIDSAHIKDASIVNAKIFDLDAAKLTTGFISADRIEAGTIQSKHIGVNAIQPTNFSYEVYKKFNETFVSIDDAYSDGKLTPIEKRSIKEQVELIDLEFEIVKDSMATFKVPHVRVKYDALKTYLGTLDLNSETVTVLDRMAYEKSFADYYAELRNNQYNLSKEIEKLNGESIRSAKTANDLLTAWKTYGQDTLYIDDTRIAVKMIGAEQIAADSITADKIKFGSVTSKTLSEDVRTDISKGTSAYKTVADLAANLNDDNIITPVEKTFLFDKWQEIQKVSSWIDWQCTNIFKNSQDKETIYDPFYTAVRDFIAERVSKDGLNVANNIIDFAISWKGKVIVGSEAMRQVLLNYYEAENKMLGKLQQTQYNFTSNVNDKVTTASSVLDNIANDNIITKQEKPALKLQYTNIINDYDDLILAANNQGLTSSNFTTAYTQLVNAFNAIFANMAVDTNWSGSDLRAKMKDYSDQRGIIVQTLSNDAKNKANEAALNALSALQALGKMSDDNVITIYEKPALSFSWQNIINDYDELVAACVTQNVSSTEFKTAYTNLKQAVDLILANPKVDTEWNGEDLRNRMKAYADARGVTVQRLSNDAKAKAEAAMAAITDAVSDRILTPSEKQQFKIKWIEEYQDFEKLKLKAQEAGINTSTGNYTGYVSAFNYINDTFTPVWTSADNSQVDPTEWKTRFENLRKYKALLENEISLVIKNIASTALANTQQLTDSLKTKADSSALMTLDHDVTTIEGTVESYGKSLTELNNNYSSLNGTLATKADASAVSTLDNKVTGIDGRVTSNSNSITTLNNSLTTTNNAVATKADSSVVTALDSKVTNIDGKVNTQANSINSLSSSYQELVAYTENGITYIPAPKGATYSRSGAITGAIQIILPQYRSNTMLKFRVEIFDYITSKSATFEIAGYTFSNGWHNVSALVTGSDEVTNIVRFGDTGTNSCIWIGEANSTWSYPRVKVINVTASYNNSSANHWKEGWSIGVVTEFVSTINLTVNAVNSQLDIKSTNASIDEFKTSQASKDSATATQINTISTTVNSHTSSIQTQQNSINGIKSEYSIKLNVNGKASGFGLVSGPKSSDFSVLSDTFKVSNGSTDIAPFSVINNEVIFNGKVSFTNITDKGWKITVIGTSAALPTAEQYSGTYIDNGNYTQDFGTSGIRVVIYDVNKNVQLDNLYNTSTAAGCTALKNEVIKLNLDTQIVTIRSVGSSLANNQDLIAAVNKLGFDGSSLNSALTYNTKTSFCGISQFIAAKNSINNIMFINADIAGKQQRAIASATIKDGTLIPESIPMDTGSHKLNEAADIAIGTLTPSIGTAQATANSKSKTFTAQPTIPYSAGDIWRNGNTIYVSSVTRATGSYTAADWTKASDVTSENTSANTSSVGSVSAASVATLVSDISNDSKLTAAEKRALNAEWERIKNTYPALITQAVNLGAIYTRTAYDTLAAYIPSLALTSQTTTGIVATTFRTNFSNYYVEEATILKNIQDKQRTNVTAAISTAAADATAKANAVRDAIPELIFAQGAYDSANALITINGVNQTYTAAVGVLVMVINQSTGVVETKTIYTADPTGFSTMKTAITAIASGKIVAMVSRQNIPMTTDTNFRDALRLIGSTDVIYNQYTRKTNNTFAIIGTKGGTAGSANEAVVSVDGNMNLDLATTSGTLIAGKLSPNSTSYVDGGLILTNSINANSIKAGSITAAQIEGGSITGDKIKAGTITADRIDSKGLTIKDNSGNVLLGAGVDLNISNITGLGSFATVNKLTSANITTYVDGLGVKNLLVGSAQITSANIGTAQVDTLQIAGEAVIVPRVQFTATEFDFYSIDTEEVINSITVDAKGGAVAINFGFDRLTATVNSRGADPTIYLRLRRNGTRLRTIEFKETSKYYLNRDNDTGRISLESGLTGEFLVENYSLVTYLDVPPAGNVTYTVTLESRGLNAGKNSTQQASTPVKITARSLHIMGVRR